ncbi:claudin-3-like [Aptenodytes patagonicus]|uniref:claudin-3-like n=1 Tax=Aptenodytes patagonicus TaxID=9234 RepID=UPI003F9F80F2
MGPLSLVWGLALAPMGWVLLLAATATPRWRELSGWPGYPRDLSFSDGLWESCVEALAQLGSACRALPEDTTHFWPMRVLRAATVGSLLLGALAYTLAMLGARWWAPPPRPNLVATAGLLLMLAGAMYLGATSYMAHRVLQDLASPQTLPADRFHLGTCLYLGWSSGVAEVLAGVCLATSFCRKREFVGGPAAAPYEVDY